MTPKRLLGFYIAIDVATLVLVAVSAARGGVDFIAPYLGLALISVLLTIDMAMTAAGVPELS